LPEIGEEDYEESDLELRIPVSRVFQGSIAALQENESFKERWTEGMEETWPPEILRDL
jgi:hypothetical protein